MYESMVSNPGQRQYFPFLSNLRFSPLYMHFSKNMHCLTNFNLNFKHTNYYSDQKPYYIQQTKLFMEVLNILNIKILKSKL